jgi:hypothetical protein
MTEKRRRIDLFLTTSLVLGSNGIGQEFAEKPGMGIPVPSFIETI